MSTIIGVKQGGTGTNLGATGGTSQVLKQVTSGGAITVGQLAASDLSNGTTGSGAAVLGTSPSISTSITLTDGTGTLITGFGTIATVAGQPFFQSATGYWAFQSQTANTPARFYILTKGAPTGTACKFEMFLSDYIADGTNYSGFNIIGNNTTNTINIGPNFNGTGTRNQLIIGGNYNASSLQSTSPWIKMNTDNTMDLRANAIITFSNASAEVMRTTSTGVSIGTATQTNGKVIIDTNTSAATVGLRLFNLAAGTGNNVALAFGSTGQYGFIDYDPLSTNGIRYSALGPLRFGYNSNAAYASSTFTEVFRTNTSGQMGIGQTSINAAAILEIASTTKGFLLPRMTKTQRDAISSVPAGLMVYQTDNTPGLRVYNGTNWIKYTETTD